MELHVISATPKAGIAKGSNKPYSLLIVDGIFTDDMGVMKTCELVFFNDPSRPAPSVVPNQKYTPVIKMVVTGDKKLTAVIDNLVPVKKIQAAA